MAIPNSTLASPARAQLLERLATLETVEAELAREHDLLASVMRATDVMLVYLDPGFNFVWVNAAYAETCRMPPEDMVGRNHFALYPDEENEAIFRQVRDTGEAVFFKDKPFVFPDQPERGTTYWDWSLVPVMDGAGGVGGLVFSLRETTRHKRSELARQESDGKLRLFIEHAPAALAMFDRDMRYLAVSRRWLDDFQLGDRDVLGLLHYEVFPQLPGYIKDAHRRGLAGEVIRVDEDRFEWPDGSCQWLRWEVRPWHDASGAVGGIVIFIEDISARKQAELALAERKSLLRTITEGSPDAIYVLDRDHCLRYFNKASLELARHYRRHPGLRLEDVLGREVEEIFGDSELSRSFRAEDEQVMSTGRPTSVEVVVDGDGGPRHVLTARSPLFGGDGVVTGLVGVARDITVHKEAEAARLAALERQRDTLVREVHHRIKNHLQGMLGLLRQHEARQPALGVALEEVIGQISVIAEIYGLQSRRANAPVVLGELIETVVRGQACPVDSACPPAGDQPGPCLATDEAVPIALVINELVTNACKHRGQGGRAVRVELQPVPAGVVLRVRGGPARLPDGFEFGAARGLGTGLELARSLLPGVGARLDFSQEGDEVVATLELAAPVLLPSRA